MNNILTNEELERLLIQFYGSDYTEASSKDKQKIIDSYRKVEEENNKQIELAGGVQNWYASGQGRMI